MARPPTGGLPLLTPLWYSTLCREAPYGLIHHGARGGGGRLVCRPFVCVEGGMGAKSRELRAVRELFELVPKVAWNDATENAVATFLLNKGEIFVLSVVGQLKTLLSIPAALAAHRNPEQRNTSVQDHTRLVELLSKVPREGAKNAVAILLVNSGELATRSVLARMQSILAANPAVAARYRTPEQYREEELAKDADALSVLHGLKL